MVYNPIFYVPLGLVLFFNYYPTGLLSRWDNAISIRLFET